MSTGSDLADQIMTRLRAGVGVTKAAGALAPELPLTEAVVRELCEQWGGFLDKVHEHTEYTTKVLKAIAAPTAEEAYRRQFGPELRPQEWRTGLIPQESSAPMRGNDERFS